MASWWRSDFGILVFFALCASIMGSSDGDENFFDSLGCEGSRLNRSSSSRDHASAEAPLPPPQLKAEGDDDDDEMDLFMPQQPSRELGNPELSHSQGLPDLDMDVPSPEQQLQGGEGNLDMDLDADLEMEAFLDQHHHQRVPQAPPQPRQPHGKGRGRARGRPKGGRFMRIAFDELDPSSVQSPERRRDPEERGIAYARRCRELKLLESRKEQPEATVKLSQKESRLLLPLAEALDSVREVASGVQCRIVNAAIRSWQTQDNSVREDSSVMQLMRAPPASNHALAAFMQQSEKKTALAANEAACAIFQSDLLLWGGMLEAVKHGIESGKLKGLTITRRFRYDETPLKNRVNVLDSNAGQIMQDVSEHAKLMQTEFVLQLVCESVADGQLLVVTGRLPTILQAVEKTTGRCTKRCLLNMMECVPLLQPVSYLFATKRHISCCDRYAANTLAEKSLGADDPSWVRGNWYCDSHRVAQVLRCSGQLLPQDVSGMLSCALAMRDMGALVRLRQILREVLLAKLEICYDEPPGGRVQQYRTAIFDKLLPLPQQLNRRSSKDGKVMLRLRQRFVLGQLMNGDLESPSIIHFCRYRCCRDADHTAAKFAHYAVNALLPHKCPKYILSRWTGQEACITYVSLLAAHHNLLEDVFTRFAGIMNQQLAAKPAAGDAHEDDVDAYVRSLDAALDHGPATAPEQQQEATGLSINRRFSFGLWLQASKSTICRCFCSSILILYSILYSILYTLYYYYSLYKLYVNPTVYHI